MKQTQNISAIRNSGSIMIHDVDEFLKFELDTSNEILEEDTCLDIYIPIKFDPDRVFGIDFSGGDDWINVYIDWYPFNISPSCDGDIKMYVYYCNNTTNEDDFDLDVFLDYHTKVKILKRLSTVFKDTYKMSLRDYWNHIT